MVNLSEGFPIRRHPRIFLNVLMWEHCTFDCEIFRCGKICGNDDMILNVMVKWITLCFVLGSNICPEISCPA
jgi:hypothetical protein